MTSPEAGDADLPLVVDLDDTLIRSDMLVESLWAGLGNRPWATVKAVARHLFHRPRLKAALADIAPRDPANVPVDPAIRQFCVEARAEGRKIVLASGATRRLVDAMADRLGPFDQVLASDHQTNLSGSAKAQRLTALFGHKGFDYIGDNRKDIAIWKAARTCYVARPGPRFMARLIRSDLHPVPLGERWRRRDLLLGLRPHQWIKNVLLLLPLIAAHRVAPSDLFHVGLGILSFSAAASAIYIVNDLTDLDADRVHSIKHRRIFASGRVPLKVGMIASVFLGIIALAVAMMLGWAMVAVIGVYILTTLAYSVRLKRIRWADVATLGGLYTLRVVAGAVAAGVVASGWLIGFIFPVFLGLACVKRLTELAQAGDDGVIPGRRYARRDRDDLLNVAIISACTAVGVFLAYSFSPTARMLYADLWLLRLVAIPFALWQVRMIVTGWRGTQHHDPIVFALRDWPGLILIVSAVAMMFHAAQ